MKYFIICIIFFSIVSLSFSVFCYEQGKMNQENEIYDAYSKLENENVIIQLGVKCK